MYKNYKKYDRQIGREREGEGVVSERRREGESENENNNERIKRTNDEMYTWKILIYKRSSAINFNFHKWYKWDIEKEQKKCFCKCVCECVCTFGSFQFSSIVETFSYTTTFRRLRHFIFSRVYDIMQLEFVADFNVGYLHSKWKYLFSFAFLQPSTF